MNLVECTGLNKSFGERQVLIDLNLQIKKGEILGLVGENGAGKSTFVKLLSGEIPATSGQISWTSKNSLNTRCSMVHQHYQLEKTLTGFQHLQLEFFKRQEFKWTELFSPNKAQLQNRVSLRQKDLNFQINLDQLVENLSIGDQQKLEILKAMLFEPDLLILDEPTAVLTPQDRLPFLNQVLRFKELGLTQIFIGHNLEEIFKVADRIVVFRNGRQVFSSLKSQTSIEQVAFEMVGQLKGLSHNKPNSLPTKSTVAEVQQLQLKPQAKPFDLNILHGEILGVAGLSGSGQSEMINFLTAPLGQPLPGQFILSGKNITETNAQTRKQLGLRWLSENRLQESVVPALSLHENYKLSCYDQPTSEKDLTETLNSFSVSPANPAALLQNLSGGNQQKFVVARESSQAYQLMIVAHPTRGVDIRSAEQIHQHLLDSKNKGHSFVVFSNDLAELTQISDRILVLNQHESMGLLPRDSFSEERLGLMMSGVSPS